MTGLQSARILARRGVPVVGIAQDESRERIDRIQAGLRRAGLAEAYAIRGVQQLALQIAEIDQIVIGQFQGADTGGRKVHGGG